MEAFSVSNHDGPYYNGSGTGKKYSLQVVINTNTLHLRSLLRPRTEADEAYNHIAINDFNDPFAAYYKKIVQHPGESFMISVSPFLATSSNDLKNLSPGERNCKFEDEIGNLKMFKYYTQEACEFECMIRHAIDICGSCIPWHLPQVKNSNHDS